MGRLPAGPPGAARAPGAAGAANSPFSGRLTDWPEETVSIPRKMGVTAFSMCRVFFQIKRTTTIIFVRKTAVCSEI